MHIRGSGCPNLYLFRFNRSSAVDYMKKIEDQAAQDGMASSASGFQNGHSLSHRSTELFQCRCLLRYYKSILLRFWGLQVLSEWIIHDLFAMSAQCQRYYILHPNSRISPIVVHLDTYFKGEFNSVVFFENGGELMKPQCKYYSTSNFTSSRFYLLSIKLGTLSNTAGRGLFCGVQNHSRMYCKTIKIYA